MLRADRIERRAASNASAAGSGEVPCAGKKRGGIVKLARGRRQVARDRSQNPLLPNIIIYDKLIFR